MIKRPEIDGHLEGTYSLRIGKEGGNQLQLREGLNSTMSQNVQHLH